MADRLTFTIAEACSILHPPMAEPQLRAIITALHWQPAGWRHTGKPGHPHPVYHAKDLIRLHAGVSPWLSS
jgi:hypothetical protein